MKNRYQKLAALITIGLMLYVYMPVLPTLIETDIKNEHSDINSNIKAASGHQLEFKYFAINNTELYEDGIYYCFRNDNLNFELYSSDNVSSVLLNISHPFNSDYDFDLQFTDPETILDQKHWVQSLYLPTDQELGMYNATLEISNGSTSEYFLFNISIANSKSRILKLEMYDSTCDNSMQQIIEGQLYRTYRTAQINMTCYVAKVDGFDKIDHVYLNFQNGYTANYKSINFSTKGEIQQIGAYLTQIFYLTENVSIQISPDSEQTANNWTFGVNFEFNVIAHDIEGDNFYFPWKMTISNQAPVISQFEIDNDIDYDDYMELSDANFNIKVNGTDLESNLLFGDNFYNYTRKINPSKVYFGNMDSLTSEQRKVELIHEDDQGEHRFVPTDQNNSYLVNFTVDQGYNFKDKNLYLDWTIFVGINTDQILPGSSNITIWNYADKEWDLITPATNITNWASFTQYKLSYSNDPIIDQDIGNYFNSENNINTFQLKIEFGGPFPYPIGINYVYMNFKVNRTITFSDMLLKVYYPTIETPSVFNMVNHFAGDWDNNAMRWCFNLSISTKKQSDLIGAWTFVLEVYDYGTLPYYSLNPTEINGINLLSGVSFNENDKSRSIAIASKTLRIGTEQNSIIKVTDVSLNSTNIASNDDVNISAVILDNTTDSFKCFNESYSPDPTKTEVREGEIGSITYKSVPNNPNYFYKDTMVLPINDSTQELTKDEYMINHDNNNFRLKFDPSKYTQTKTIAWIVPVKITSRFWLGDQNISRIWVDVNQTLFSSNVVPILSTLIEVYDWDNKSWILPYDPVSNAYWHTEEGEELVHIGKRETSTKQEVYHSPQWANKTQILGCINNYTNEIYFRLKFNLDDWSDQLNLSIDYFKMHVEYNNSYWAKIGIMDSISNTFQYYTMSQSIANGTHRIWNYTFPTSLYSARNFHFQIMVQNANSSIRYEWGRLEGIWKDSMFLWNPVYDSALKFNISMNFKKDMDSLEFENVEYANITNLHRNQQALILNGSLNSKYNYSSFKTFALQLHHIEADKSEDWDTTISAKEYNSTSYSSFTCNYTSMKWNVTAFFSQNTRDKIWRSGVWMYRVLVISNESNIVVTDWAEYRLMNYQPKNISLEGLLSGSYYRVGSPVPYIISFIDLEGNNNPNFATGEEYRIEIDFLIKNRDKNQTEELWDSKTEANFIRVNEYNRVFTFEGNVFFGREIQIDNYSIAYIRIRDLDQDWPQVGTIKITDRIFEVKNNKPVAVQVLNSNMTGELDDKVYRENWIRVYTEINDIDDYPHQISPRYFNLTYPVGNSIINLDCNSSYINSTTNWYYELKINRTDTLGIWNFTTNFQDPDNDSLANGDMELQVQILNNLPQLLHLWYRNLNTSSIAYVGNQTGFGIYRGNETLEITADLYDIEDSYLPSLEYSIKNVSFSLYNGYSKPEAELYNDETYSDPSFVLQLERNGSIGATKSDVNLFTSYKPTATTTGDSKYKTNTILTVRDRFGGSADVSNIYTSDMDYHNITYYYDSVSYTGGEYYVNFSLPQLFDLHSMNQNMNLSVLYNIKNGKLTVEAKNYETNNWEQISITDALDLEGVGWYTTNITLNPAKIRQFINESNGNIFSIRFISNKSILDPICFQLNKLELVYFRTSNENYERWIGTVVIPATAEFHAGDLLLNMIMMDNDNGVKEDKGNLIRVLNEPPRFIGNKTWITVNDFEVEQNTPYTVEYSPNNDDWPVIRIFVEAWDPDLPGVDINKIIIKGTTNTSGIIVNWNFGDIGFTATGKKNGTNLYIIEIIKNDKNDLNGLAGIQELFISEIIINDNEIDKCDGTKYLYSASIRVNIKITFLPTIDDDDDWKKFLPAIIVSGVSLLSVGAVIFWRRYLTYRKYLKTTD